MLHPAKVAPPNSFPADKVVIIPASTTMSICRLQAEFPSLSRCNSSCCSPREDVRISIPYFSLLFIAHSAPCITSSMSPSQHPKILIRYAPGAAPTYLRPVLESLCPPPEPAAIPAHESHAYPNHKTSRDLVPRRL